MEPGSPASRLHVVGGEDTTGWEALYRAHVVPVYRFVFARCGNRADAEDLTATVFLKALPRLRPTASEGEARAYLRATARSLLAEHWATHYGVVMAEYAEDLVPSPLPASGDEGASNRRRVAALLARLPDHYRRVLELRFLRGLSVRETAREMDVSEGNAKVLTHRGLRAAARVAEEAP
ncbi:MAG TPA: RNA polymerase sigma factor [Candidatus Dormibacteraeota bacterium]|jgi:RNA polymerase sigma-70 factor (ECF subfamily)